MGRSSSIFSVIQTQAHHQQQPILQHQPIPSNTMQFLATILAIAATASAAALSVEKRADVCSGLDSPQCCETSVDGLLVLTCADRACPLSNR